MLSGPFRVVKADSNTNSLDVVLREKITLPHAPLYQPATENNKNF